MRALLVTSQLTFVPRNYDDVAVGLAGCPHLAGLLVLRNSSPRISATALGLMAMGAPNVGGQLLRNQVGRSARRRRRAWAAHRKPVFMLDDINTEEAAELVASECIDLLVNARTRFIYRKRILQAPRLGAINVHHGLLPAQRGLMCDLWALSEGERAGFTVHAMTPKIDAGGIVHAEAVSLPGERDYLRYLEQCARREAAVLPRLLAQIAAADAVHTTPNPRPEGLVHRTNPTPAEIRKMRRAGMRL